MAAGLDVAAGVVGVLGLTIQITQIVTQFGLDWKDAPTDVKNFMNELRSLKTVLSETRTNFLDDPNFREAFRDRPSILLSELGSNAPTTAETRLSIESCKAELQMVLDGLKKRNEGSRMGWERLKGPFLAKRTRNSIDNLRHYCQLFNNMVSMDAMSLGLMIRTEMIAARREQQEWHNARENQAILTWISNLSFKEKQTDILSKRHPGTGQWLLERECFQDWRNGVHDRPSALWCPGMPGAGKSVMTSVVIDHLHQVFTEKDVSISYIYCDYKDRKTQTTVNLISSLVKQMILQQSDMPKDVIDLYTKHGNGQSSLSLEDLSRLLSSLSNHFRRSFILVDALDEHFVNDDEENAMQLTLLDILLNLQQKRRDSRGCTLFFTSRENGLIQERLAGCVRLDIRAAGSDIELYSRSRIHDPSKFRFANNVRDDVDLGNQIVSGLVEKAQGMFLLPRLHLDRLGCQTSVRNLRKALESLPTKLGDTYNDAMARIQGQVQEHSKLALSALSWISNALRPLRMNELQHALAVRRGDQSLDEEALEDEALIISVSAGLITLDVQGGTIRLVHFTVEEYFRDRKQELFPDADSQIAEICLTYLSFDIFENGRCSSDQKFEIRLEENCFLDYAARNWGHHANKGEEHTVEDLALNFLKNNNKTSCASQILFMSDYHDYRRKGYTKKVLDRVSGAHLAAWFGLINIMKKLLDSETIVNAKDSNGETALSYAARKGNETVVELLLGRNDVIANAQDQSGRTSLSYAAGEGHETIVKLLIDRDDVEVNSQDFFGRTALSHAALKGHETITGLILGRDDVIADSQDGNHQTPLSRAAEEGHEIIVKLLVDRDDVEVDSRDELGRTPLSWTAVYGHETIVKLLLNQGAVADWQDEDDRTPLSHAAAEGHERVVKLLLERDDVVADSRDINDRTPLSYAAEKGHKRDALHRTPLSYAAEEGHEEVVELLLKRDDVVADSRDVNDRTPLSYAAKNGYERVVKLLLERDDVVADSRDRDGRTPLSRAAEWGNEGVVKLLLERDDVAADSRDVKNRTPLSYAAEERYEKVVKLLEEKLKNTKAEE
ncbi:MAG: hypothetical protein ASARMPREDX12_001771 [Alectoria sarmentosa]|nr:MAG: hypothetical protein ASARMPREDX12_001771 [Alectoria sarmentosa]